jgi:Zn-dependent protease/predicted transcriptional regulator
VIRSGIPLGKFFGIPIRLHWSWFIIFALVTWSLGAYYFPDTYPNWSTTTDWVIGVSTSILFFSSVLAHELAHSLVAKAAGIQIRSITLFIFGGVSQITQEPERPGVEFRMAVVGPATSLLIAGIFGVIRLAVMGVSEPAAALAAWLGWINLALAVFNLIPGFPLDGGRVLRSILWWRTGDLRRSTRSASNVGRVVGYLFIAAGVFLIVWGGNWLSGLWIAAIGWFLQNAAQGSYRQLDLRDMLQGHTVSEVMLHECVAISPQLTLEQLVNDHVLRSGHRCFPVAEDSRVFGLVTTRDVKAVPRELWPTKTVREVMTPFDKVKWVRPNENLSNVLQQMTAEDANELPVVEAGAIVGMVARDNLQSFIDTRAELGM